MDTVTTHQWKTCISAVNSEQHRTILSAVRSTVVKQLTYDGPMTTIGPMDGFAGQLLFCFYDAIANDDEQLYDFALERMNHFLETLPFNGIHSLCSGTAGIMHTLYTLENADIVPDAGDVIDDGLIKTLSKNANSQLEKGDYDYMHGGLGIAVALLNSAKRIERYAPYLANVVHLLDQTAQRDKIGIYWLFKNFGKRGTEMSVSLGLSHGLPSIIAILSKISQLGIEADLCNQLIKEALDFMLSSRSFDATASLYPTALAFSRAKHYYVGRLGWCYGDLSIAVALHYALKVIPEPRYEKEIWAILDHCMKRDTPEKARVADGSFCHGACGVAHMYARLYNAYNDERLKRSACQWFDLTLGKLRMKDGGIQVYNEKEEAGIWEDNGNVITGIAGVGLTILSGLNPIAPDWDEMFLLKL